MLGGFLPPVVFTITTNAAQAMAGFAKVNTQLKVMEAQALKTGKALTATSKAMTVATAAAKAFTVVMGAFAAYGVKEVMQLEQAYTRLGQTLAAVGLSTEENRTKLADAAQGMELLGFDAANASDALAILLQTTKDVDKSQKLMATAADLARARQMDLSTAARMLSRAQAGQTRIFTMFGIQLDKNKDKTTATREAMEKLTKVIGGQAEAYTKTFAGQLAVLGKQIENVAEGIGAALLPYLVKFLQIIQRLGKFLNEHREILAGVAFLIGTVLVTAVVNLTKKLYTLVAAWMAANWATTLIVASFIAVGAGLVYLWNKFEGFRKSLILIGKVVLVVAESIVTGLKWAVNAVALLIRGFANAQIAIGKLFGDETMQKQGKVLLSTIDKVNEGFDTTRKAIANARNNLDSFSSSKIDLSKFKLPSLAIPKFENGQSFEEAFGDTVTKGLAKAKREIKSFNKELAIQFKSINKMWQSLVGRNFESDIISKINDPIEQVIYDAQASIDAYADASRRYASVTTNLEKAQKSYRASLKTGNADIISAAEDALRRAEEASASVLDDMSGALSDIRGYQSQMISTVADLYEEIGVLENERTKILQEAQKERLELEKNYNAEIVRLRRDYDTSVLRAQEDAAKRRAEIVKQSVDQLRDAFRNATYTSIGDIFRGLTFEGRYIKGGTAEKILEALGLQTEKAATLASDAATLAGLGFSQTFIEEVIAQGPDIGHQLAQTIIQSTPDSIRQMQAYWNELQKTSRHGVDSLATNLNSGMRLATEELVAQLRQVDVDLNATLSDLQIELQSSLASAFSAYSDALDVINNRTTQQITDIDNQIEMLRIRIRMLKEALTEMQKLGAPGTGVGANIIPVVPTPVVPTPIVPIPSMGGSMYETTPYGPGSENKVDGDIVVTVNANTQASPQEIANSVAWSIRTSSDIQYNRVGGGGGGREMQML